VSRGLNLGEPDAADLLQAVADFLAQTVAPRLEGREAFLAKVAVNTLGIVRRQLMQDGDGALLQPLNAEADAMLAASGQMTGGQDRLRALADAIRSGVLAHDDPALRSLVLRLAAARVSVEQPAYGSLKLVPDTTGEHQPPPQA
jgi:hypothetical protein